VSPKYIVVDLVGNLINGVVATFAASLPVWLLTWGAWWWVLTIAVGIVSLVLIALTPRRVRAIGYLLRDDDLLFRRGIMFQRFVAVPFGRMQLVDITRGPLARALGLAELKLVTAAAATGVVIPGLALADAEELRDHLVALAETRRAGL
jgi:membrane protein YdbS with pleckstrin-like domain